MTAYKKLVYVQDAKVGAARPFNIAQVKRCFIPTDVAQALFVDMHNGLSFSASDEEEEIIVHLTEIIDPNDPRASSKQMSQAKRKEIKGLLDRGTFSIILRERVPPDGNVLPGRFDFAINSTEDGQIKFKARCVIDGHRDRIKNFMVHSAATLQNTVILKILK